MHHILGELFISSCLSIVVTAEDDSRETYTINVTRAASSDASLSALALSAGSLNPDFDSATFAYTTNVANTVASLTVSPTTTDSTASVTVNGIAVTSGAASVAINLAPGAASEINVVVTAQDGSPQTYTISVTIAPAITISVATVNAVAGIAIADVTITSTGGTVANYAIDPAIDNGLDFDTASSTISGTPTAAADRVAYTITASNVAGSVTATVDIAVPNAYDSTASTVDATAAINADGLTVITLGQSSNSDIQVAGATITLPSGMSGAMITITGASNNVPAAQPDETIPNRRLSLVDIAITGFGNSEPVTICLPHGDISEPGLYHAATSNGWNLLASQQVVGKLVCGEAIAFSPFAVFGNMRTLGADSEAQILNAVLPQLLRATTKMTVDAISRRIDQALDASGRSAANFTIGGSSSLQQLVNNNIRTALHRELNVKQMLNTSAFLIPLNAAGDNNNSESNSENNRNNNGKNNVTLWGSGDYLNLADDVGEDGANVDWEGEVIGGSVGIDAYLEPNLIAGGAFSFSGGDVSYQRDGVNDSSGTLSNTLYSVHPYLAYDLAQGGRIWGTFGYGQGEITINDTAASNATAATVKTQVSNRDTQLYSHAFGGRGDLLSRDNWLNIPGTTALSLKGEVSLSSIRVDKSQLINAQPLSINAHRYRMVLEGSQQRTLAGGGSISPSVELGIRYDRTGDETASGIELAGSYRYSSPKGLEMELRAHTLLAQQSNYQEWGLSAQVKYQATRSGQGLRLSLQPAWGNTPINVADRIWQASAVTNYANASYANDANDGDSSNKKLQLNSELGYGLPGLYGHGLLTPYTGLGISNGEQSYNIGARWAIDPASQLNLIGERKQSGDSIQLRGDFRF